MTRLESLCHALANLHANPGLPSWAIVCPPGTRAERLNLRHDCEHGPEAKRPAVVGRAIERAALALD